MARFKVKDSGGYGHTFKASWMELYATGDVRFISKSDDSGQINTVAFFSKPISSKLIGEPKSKDT